MSSQLELVVDGVRYSGWKSIRVTRSIESLAGSFALEVSDRWGDGDPWAIAEEDPCRVEIDGTVVIDGYVDKRDLSATKDARTLAYQGRDRAASLVDSSAEIKKWTYRNISLADFVKTLAQPFGVPVSVQAGLALAKVPKLAVTPGETAFEAMRRAAADAEVLLVSDGAGGILITRSSTARAAPLVEHQNIVSAQVTYDGAERFHRYVLLAQNAGTDEAHGQVLRVRAEAIDEGVRRTDRVLLIRADKGYTLADARRRVDWEARTRAAKAETVNVTVLGWTQPSGKLWPVNAHCYVKAPNLIGVDGELVISEVEYSIGESGQLTRLKLVRPDAFAPEVTATKPKVKSSGGRWKELDKGGL